MLKAITTLAVLLSTLIPSTSALVFAVDSSTLVPESNFATAKSQGFTKAIIRGYEEACNVGGQVDPNFVQTYNNARAAGITNIDTYWFPCSGPGNPCKSFATQIAELVDTFNTSSMDIGTIWIDIELDSIICDNWNYGAAGNLEHAQELIAAAQASGFNFGIYSSFVDWVEVFQSESVVLDNSLPLWFPDYDGVEASSFHSV